MAELTREQLQGLTPRSFKRYKRSIQKTFKIYVKHNLPRERGGVLKEMFNKINKVLSKILIS